MSPGLAVNVALNAATAVLLAYTGALVLARPAATPAARRALRLFATWWFSVAAVVVLGGSHTLLALVGVTWIPLHVALADLTAVPLAVALWALLAYLLYVYTGRPSALLPLTVAYAFFLAFEVYYFSSFGFDRTLVENAWQVQLVGSTQPASWVSIAFGVLLAVPILFVVAAYAGLYRSTRDATVRRRITLVSTAFGLWFGVVLLAFLLGWDRAPWFPLAWETPGLVAGVLTVMAYRRRGEPSRDDGARETRAG